MCRRANKPNHRTLASVDGVMKSNLTRTVNSLNRVTSSRALGERKMFVTEHLETPAPSLVGKQVATRS